MQSDGLPYWTAPTKASPAPVVSTISEGGIIAAVPINSLALTVPIPSAPILRPD